MRVQKSKNLSVKVALIVGCNIVGHEQIVLVWFVDVCVVLVDQDALCVVVDQARDAVSHISHLFDQ